jgi:1,4-dihydroxy-2-naphthoyl-CoA hydrolase
MSKINSNIWHSENLDLNLLNRDIEQTLAGHLGICFTEWGHDWLRATMPVDMRTRQPYGRLHGGASVAFAESLAGCAANLTLDPTISNAVGLEINANHVRAARDGYVHAVAKPEALGRRIQVWSVRIEDDDNNLICISRMTAAIIAVNHA